MPADAADFVRFRDEIVSAMRVAISESEARLEARMDARFDAVDTRFDTVDARIDGSAAETRRA